MFETFKPVEISEYYIKQAASGLKKEIYQTLFKPLFDVLDSKDVFFFNPNVNNANFNPNQPRVKYGRWIGESDFFERWNDAPTIHLQPSEWDKITDIKQLRKKVKRYLLDETRKIPLSRPELGKIRFSGKSIDEFITYSVDRDKLLAAKQIPQFIREGKLGQYTISNKNRQVTRGDRIEGFYPIYCNLKTKNEIKKAEVLIGKKNDGKLFFTMFLDYDRKTITNKKDSTRNQDRLSTINILTDISKNFNPDSSHNVTNAKDTLVNAVMSGRIYYKAGAFRSDKPFSNAIALELEKLGAKYKSGAYFIPRSMVPVELENAIALVSARSAAKIAALNALLVKLANNIDKDTLVKAFIEKSVTLMFKKLQYDLEESTKESKIPVIDISTEINPDDIKLNKQSETVVKDYIYNMDYWVKDWKAKEIIKMRRAVLYMVQNGERPDAIKKYLMRRRGIAEKKAEFLARNESGIAGSVLKAAHYQKMGCQYFMWNRSSAKEKRELHLEYAKEKNNQYGIGGTNIFAFNNPPIIEQITLKSSDGTKSYIPKPDGKRGLPRQTYNCLCSFTGIKYPEYYVKRAKIENDERNIFRKLQYAIENSKQRNNYTWRYRRFGEG